MKMTTSLESDIHRRFIEALGGELPFGEFIAWLEASLSTEQVPRQPGSFHLGYAILHRYYEAESANWSPAELLSELVPMAFNYQFPVDTNLASPVITGASDEVFSYVMPASRVKMEPAQTSAGVRREKVPA
jgi:hypothetical protein